METNSRVKMEVEQCSPNTDPFTAKWSGQTRYWVSQAPEPTRPDIKPLGGDWEAIALGAAGLPSRKNKMSDPYAEDGRIVPPIKDKEELRSVMGYVGPPALKALCAFMNERLPKRLPQGCLRERLRGQARWTRLEWAVAQKWIDHVLKTDALVRARYEAPPSQIMEARNYILDKPPRAMEVLAETFRKAGVKMGDAGLTQRANNEAIWSGKEWAVMAAILADAQRLKGGPQ